jgi:hypothetical protein
MKNRRVLIGVLSLGLFLALLVVFTTASVTPAVTQGASMAPQEPLGTAFTYQGRLIDGDGPASGDYDLRFMLYDAEIGGSQLGSIVYLDDVNVTAGIFTVQLDFGSGAFSGAACWLEIGVRPGDSTGAYTPLNPRQALTAAPYALYTSSAPWSGLTGVPAGFADGVDDDTTYTAGDGLSVDGTQFSLDFGGTGVATTAARSDHNHDAVYAPIDLVPSGAVMFFNLETCPSGWHELQEAQGRYLVGLTDGGTLSATVGTALSDSEDRPVGLHTHGINDPGHSHSIYDPGHTHGMGEVAVSGSAHGDLNGAPNWLSLYTRSTYRSTTGISINSSTSRVTVQDAGTVSGTNAPYLQLLVCEKD